MLYVLYLLFKKKNELLGIFFGIDILRLVGFSMFV